jgi:hypothetical protein
MEAHSNMFDGLIAACLVVQSAYSAYVLDSNTALMSLADNI